jgi:hypothetical protein
MAAAVLCHGGGPDNGRNGDPSRLPAGWRAYVADHASDPMTFDNALRGAVPSAAPDAHGLQLAVSHAREIRADASVSTWVARRPKPCCPTHGLLRAAPQVRSGRPGGFQKNFADRVAAVLPAQVEGKAVEIWFQDEARIGQQGTLTRIWARRGTRPRAPRDQRYAWACIFGAVCPQRQATAALVMPHANADALSLHLREISGEIAANAHAMLVLDGAGYHVAADLDTPDNITLLHLPPYAPELNPVENIWAYLRGNKLAITVFDDYDHIVQQCCKAWNFFADDKSAIASITARDWAAVNI